MLLWNVEWKREKKWSAHILNNSSPPSKISHLNTTTNSASTTSIIFLFHRPNHFTTSENIILLMMGFFKELSLSLSLFPLRNRKLLSICTPLLSMRERRARAAVDNGKHSKKNSDRIDKPLIALVKFCKCSPSNTREYIDTINLLYRYEGGKLGGTGA